MTDNFFHLTGPILSPRSGRERKIVVLLHGYGSNGDNLIDLGSAWGPQMPDVTFVAPNGFDPWEEAPNSGGYQWFSFHDWSKETILRGLWDAAPRINGFLDNLLHEKNMTDKDLILGGFSQGAMVSLYAALCRPRAISGVLAYSGCLVWPGDQKPASCPPVSLIHGRDDTVVPYQLLEDSRAQLASLGVPVTALSLDHMAHSIDNRAMDAGLRFMQRQFESFDSCGEKVKS